MAAYDLEEQEQLSEIKAFWQQYGNLITGLVALAATLVVAYQGWNWYQRNQAAQANGAFAAVQQAAAANDLKKTRDATGELLEKYSGTVQAGLAALISAKVQFEGGDAATAKAQLGWAAEKGAEAEIRDLARLRLATVLLDEKAYDEALRQLEHKPSASFVPRYLDLKGDVLLAQGKPAEAKVAYRDALAALDAQAREAGAAAAMRPSALKEVVQVKLDALGGAQ